MKKIIFVLAPAGSGKSSNISCIYNFYGKKISKKDICVYDMDIVLNNNDQYKSDIKKFIKDHGGKSQVIKSSSEKLYKMSEKLNEIQEKNMRGKGLLRQKNDQLSKWIKNDKKIIVVDGGIWKQVSDELCGKLQDQNSSYIHLAKNNNYKFVLFFIYTDIKLAKDRVIHRFIDKIKKSDYTARLPNLYSYDNIYNAHMLYVRKIIHSGCMDDIIAVDNKQKICNFVDYRKLI